MEMRIFRSSWTDTPEQKALKTLGIQTEDEEADTQNLLRNAELEFIQQRDDEQELVARFVLLQQFSFLTFLNINQCVHTCVYRDSRFVFLHVNVQLLISRKHKKKSKRKESLLEIHEKKLKKKKKVHMSINTYISLFIYK